MANNFPYTNLPVSGAAISNGQSLTISANTTTAQKLLMGQAMTAQAMPSYPQMKPEDIEMSRAALLITDAVSKMVKEYSKAYAREIVAYVYNNGINNVMHATFNIPPPSSYPTPEENLREAIFQGMRAGLGDAFRVWMERQSAENEKNGGSE